VGQGVPCALDQLERAGEDSGEPAAETGRALFVRHDSETPDSGVGIPDPASNAVSFPFGVRMIRAAQAARDRNVDWSEA
jgi:hypothetical protein